MIDLGRFDDGFCATERANQPLSPPNDSPVAANSSQRFQGIARASRRALSHLNSSNLRPVDQRRLVYLLRRGFGPRRRAHIMAARESQGLQIALIIFVILSIATSVTTYLAFTN